jgi:hypothetical protein
VEVLSFLNVLWRRRVLVAIGLVVALALAFAVGGGRPASHGVAASRVLLDTTRSALVENAPFGAETLPWRANLLVHLMGTEESKRRLAERLDIPPGRLAVVDEALSVPDIRASMPKAAAEAAAVTAAPYVLTVSLNAEQLPIVSIGAHAPDRRRAAALVAAATEVMKDEAPPPDTVPDYSYDVAQAMASTKVPRALQGFVVEDFGPIRAKTVEMSKAPVKAMGVSVLALALWCAGAALLPAARSPRR